MKLHYKGKYNFDPDSIPHGEHKEGAVKFREASNTMELAGIAAKISICSLALTAVPAAIRCGRYVVNDIGLFLLMLVTGLLAALILGFPHEILHAVCFKEDVYIYTNLKEGMLFVTGPETMSKGRFIFMSLLPNIIFGFIPYFTALIFPDMLFMLCLGMISISMGAGDFYNVYNALTQMPEGSRTYLYKLNSFWYIP